MSDIPEKSFEIDPARPWQGDPRCDNLKMPNFISFVQLSHIVNPHFFKINVGRRRLRLAAAVSVHRTAL